MCNENGNSVNEIEKLIKCHRCHKVIEKSEGEKKILTIINVETLKEKKEGQVLVCSSCADKIHEEDVKERREYRNKIIFTIFFYLSLMAIISIIAYYHNY